MLKAFVTYVPRPRLIKLWLTVQTATTVDDTGRADTVRRVSAPQIVQADTVRTLTDKPTKDSIVVADTARGISNADTGVFDTDRNTGGDTGIIDLLRDVQTSAGAFFDTLRVVGKPENIVHDTMRILSNTSGTQSDTLRIISAAINTLNPVEVNLNIQKGTISDVFNIQLAHDVQLGDCITGRILDFPYKMYAYEVDFTGLIRKVTGMYDIDKLLYTPFAYGANTSMTAKDHAKQIARRLGKLLDFRVNDFYPSDTYAGTGATIQNLASSLFGWAGNLPQRWINVFLRGDTLHIIQRGMEPNTIDITGTAHSRPEINRKIVRSVWSGRGNGGAHNSLQVNPIGFTGTIIFGDAECTYSGGYLVRSVTATDKGTETTTYSYDYDGYITHKSVESADYTADTSYSYANTGGDKYLATEETVTTDKHTARTSTQTVQHVYLGNGFYGTAHYTDGVLDSSVVSNGKPGGKASQFTIDQSNLGLGGSTAHYPKEKDNRFTSALFDTEFPIANTSMLKQLTKDIEWLDRKTEETVSMDIWQYSHVIDFTDKIILDGKTYYLESNNVTQTPTEVKQSIVLKRWY